MKKIILILLTMQLLFADTTYEKLDYSGINLEERTINQYEKQYFTVDVPNGQVLTVKLFELSADVDLYVTQGWTEPKLSSSYCKSTNGGIIDEECTVVAPNYKRHNIMVYGFRDATYKIVPAVKTEDIPSLLGNQAIKKYIKINTHHAYRVDSKPGETVTIRLSELTADADLKLNRGQKVRRNSFVCKSTNGGTNVDECSITIPTDKGYDDLVYIYIDVFGFRSANYKIERIKSDVSEDNPCISLSDLKEKIRNNENVEDVNTSCITDMKTLFSMSSFNQDISAWDVSNVTDMSYMFFNADSFNQDISSWDVSNVENMSYMFKGKDTCLAFNQNISGWDVLKVKNMDYMFWQNCYDGYIFTNQDLSSWNVSNVINHRYFFVTDSNHDNIEPLWN